MFTSKWKSVTVLAATLGAFSLGAIGHNLAFQGTSAPAAKKVPKEMLEKRRDAAKQVWESSLDLLQARPAVNGRVAMRISDLLGWSERLLDAELPLCEKRADRIAAFKAHVDRTRTVEQFAIAKVKFARGTSVSAKTATYERINAEIRYFEETRKTLPPPTDYERPEDDKRIDKELPKPKEKKEEK